MDGGRFDLAVAWEWQLDQGFLEQIRSEASGAGVGLLEISPGNIESVLERVRRGLQIGLLLDRASDVERAFAPLQDLVVAGGGAALNRSRQADWASDKATMHMELLAAGLEVPYTLLLGTYGDEPELAADRLAPLGSPLIVKPASFGGGVGVRTARTLAAVQWCRTQFPREKFLLQELIVPALLDGRRAWFRPMYFCGAIDLLWWDDLTHLYASCTADEVSRHGLERIRTTMQAIAGLTRLDFFTAELCIDGNGRLVVVDYVNVPCDMRLQSMHPDGVPDAIVRQVAGRLVHEAVVRRPPR